MKKSPGPSPRRQHRETITVKPGLRPQFTSGTVPPDRRFQPKCACCLRVHKGPVATKTACCVCVCQDSSDSGSEARFADQQVIVQQRPSAVQSTSPLQPGDPAYDETYRSTPTDTTVITDTYSTIDPGSPPQPMGIVGTSAMDPSAQSEHLFSPPQPVRDPSARSVDIVTNLPPTTVREEIHYTEGLNNEAVNCISMESRGKTFIDATPKPTERVHVTQHTTVSEKREHNSSSPSSSSSSHSASQTRRMEKQIVYTEDRPITYVTTVSEVQESNPDQPLVVTYACAETASSSELLTENRGNEECRDMLRKVGMQKELEIVCDSHNLPPGFSVSELSLSSLGASKSQDGHKKKRSCCYVCCPCCVRTKGSHSERQKSKKKRCSLSSCCGRRSRSSHKRSKSPSRSASRKTCCQKCSSSSCELCCCRKSKKKQTPQVTRRSVSDSRVTCSGCCRKRNCSRCCQGKGSGKPCSCSPCGRRSRSVQQPVQRERQLVEPYTPKEPQVVKHYQRTEPWTGVHEEDRVYREPQAVDHLEHTVYTQPQAVEQGVHIEPLVVNQVEHSVLTEPQAVEQSLQRGAQAEVQGVPKDPQPVSSTVRWDSPPPATYQSSAWFDPAAEHSRLPAGQYYSPQGRPPTVTSPRLTGHRVERKESRQGCCSRRQRRANSGSPKRKRSCSPCCDEPQNGCCLCCYTTGSRSRSQKPKRGCSCSPCCCKSRKCSSCCGKSDQSPSKRKWLCFPFCRAKKTQHSTPRSPSVSRRYEVHKETVSPTMQMSNLSSSPQHQDLQGMHGRVVEIEKLHKSQYKVRKLITTEPNGVEFQESLML